MSLLDSSKISFKPIIMVIALLVMLSFSVSSAYANGGCGGDTPCNCSDATYRTLTSSRTFNASDDLTNCSAGLAISTSNIVLDCNNYAVVGDYSSNGITVNGNNVTIQNCIISNYSDGITFTLYKNLTFYNNTIFSLTGKGITGEMSSDWVRVLGNEIYNVDIGIYFYAVRDGDIIADNYIHDVVDTGMALMWMVNANISNNIINNTIGGHGISTNVVNSSNFTNNVITNCQVSGIYMIGSANNIISGGEIGNNNDGGGSDYAGIRITSASIDNTITGIYMHNNEYGAIRLEGADNTVIDGNNIDNNCGNIRQIYITSSDSVIIQNNNITDGTGKGVEVYTSPNLQVLNNNISNNAESGVYLSSSSSTTNTLISDNIFSENGANCYPTCNGVTVYDEGNATLVDNDFISQPNAGIYAFNSEVYVFDGNFINNGYDHDGYGIYDNSGPSVYWTVTKPVTCTNNTIYVWGDVTGTDNITGTNCPIYVDDYCVSGDCPLQCGDTITTNLTFSDDLDCSGYSADAFTVGADNITIDCNGHTITGPGNYAGIFLNGRSGVTVKNCTITGFNKGIWLKWNNAESAPAAHNNILDNTIVDNYYGIALWENSDSNVISRNNVSYNGEYGIMLRGAYNNNVTNNTANLNYNVGIRLSNNAYNNIVKGNTVSENNGGRAHGIEIVSNAYSNTIDNNTIESNSGDGIFMADCSTTNTLSNNKVNDNSNYGVELINSNNHELVDNDLSGNGMGGIYATNSHITVENGNLINNGWDDGSYGIYDDSGPSVSWIVNKPVECINNTIYLWGDLSGLNYINRTNCVVYIDGSELTNDTFCGGEYGTCDCGDYVMGDVTLEDNLECDGDALVVGASNVTIDCDGYYLMGTDSGNGIYSMSSDVTIKNCGIYDFSYGISLYHAYRNIIQNNDIDSNSNSAVYLDHSDYNKVLGNNLTNSGSYGFYIWYADSNQISNNYVYGGYTNVGSCPFLYLWDGNQYNYYTDLAGEPLGAQWFKTNLYESGIYELGDFSATEGTYKLKVREVIPESDFFDEAKLVLVDVPEGYSVLNTWHYTYANNEAPKKEFMTIKTPKAPVSAVDKYGNNVLDSVSSKDGTPLAMFNNEPNSVIVDFGEIKNPQYAKLVISGWTSYELNEGLPIQNKLLIEIQDSNGNWQIAKTYGMFIGDTKTFVFDVSGILETGNTKMRITASYSPSAISVIDQVLLDDSAPVEFTVTYLNPSYANLQWGGAADYTYPTTEHRLIDITDEQLPNKENFLMYGKFTKYGDVKPLLSSTDDMYAIMRHGDEIVLEFNDVPKADGTNRQVFLLADVMYSIKYSIKGFVSDKIEPLPFHGMSKYPYSATESYPTDAEHQDYLAAWNTREYIKTNSGATGGSLPYSFNNTILNNVIDSFSSQGIYTYYEKDTTIRGNTITNTGYAIYIEDSNGTVIESNKINQSTYAGIYLDAALDTSITGDRINGSAEGVYMSSESTATIQSVELTSNLGRTSGLHVTGDSIAHLYNSIFTDNYQYAIYSDSGSSVFWKIDNTATCTNNEVSIYSGWISINGGTLTATNCAITVAGEVFDPTVQTGSVSEDVSISSGENGTVGGQDAGVSAEISSGSGYSATVTIETYSELPSGVSGFTSTALGAWIEITATTELDPMQDYAIIKIYYTDAEVAAAGLDESSLFIQYYNSTSGTWETFSAPNGGVNTVENYVWARTTHFSGFGIFGTSTTVVGGSSSGGAALPKGTTIAWGGETSQQSMKVGDTLKFMLNGANHSVRLAFIGSDYVTLSVASTPQSVTVKLGETTNIDVDRSGTFDITATLDKIEAGKAYLTFGTYTAPGEQPPVIEKPPAEQPSAEKPSIIEQLPPVISNNLAAVIVLGALAVVAILYFVMKPRKK